MEWRDQGVLLSARPHGESAAIIEVFTPEYGRPLGVVRGGCERTLLWARGRTPKARFWLSSQLLIAKLPPSFAIAPPFCGCDVGVMWV